MTFQKPSQLLCSRKKELLDYAVWIDDIGPPVIVDAVGLARGARQVIEPPDMMGAHIAVAPILGIDLTGGSAQVGEVVPIIAIAQHFAAIAPVVVALAVGRKVNIAALRALRCDLIVATEAFPKVLLFAMSSKDLAHNRLGAMAEIFEHTANIAFIVEAHNHIAARTAGSRDRIGIAPERAGASHGAFPTAHIGRPKQPNLVALAAPDAIIKQIVVDQTVVVKAVGLVKAAAAFPSLQEAFIIVAKAIDFGWKPIDQVAFDDGILHKTAAGLGEVLNIELSESLWVVPA